MNLRRWFKEHSLKLLAIRDTPQAIAGGVAIGIFFGFTPLFGLKTLLSILFAWLTRSNILAAVLGAFVCAAPMATLAYLLTKPLVVRYHKKHPRPPGSEDKPR